MPQQRQYTSALVFTLVSSIAVMIACGNGSTSGSSTASDSNDTGAADAPRSSGPGTNGDATLGSSDGTTSSVDAGPPAVRFVGRFDTRDPAGPICAWPGCRIIADFEGSTVSVRLDERAESWMKGGPSEWDVTVDGTLLPKLVSSVGVHDYVLARDLGKGPHRVELFKRSEAQDGFSQFLGYDFGDGGSLLPPPPPSARHIEVVGDSQPAGFGVEGPGVECAGPAWAARYENFHISMSARLADLLGADLHGTVYSGKGLVKNITRTDHETMPILYPRANPLDDTSVWDFSQFVPDVIVMMIGGNDFAIGEPYDDGPPSLFEFTSAVSAMVATFRSHAPSAHIFLALSPSVSDVRPPGRHSRTNVKSAYDAVARQRANDGDDRVYSVAPPVAAESELTGCDGHGNAAYHERVAQQLAELVKAQTGW